MKLNKKIVAIIMSLITIINLSIFSVFQVFAHSAILDVEYDNCIASNNADGINEAWYVLNSTNSQLYHISHEEQTIKYYFSEIDPVSGYTWTTDISASEAQAIKDAYANSMKMWNNL